MTFVPPIIAPIVAPIATPGGAVVIPWYLFGGVTAGQCLAAYYPKGAADLASSYVNLNNPGTYNAAPGTAPTFSGGWKYDTAGQYLTTGIATNKDYTVLIQFVATASGIGTVVGRLLGDSLSGNSFDISPRSSDSSVQFNQTGAVNFSPRLDNGNLCRDGANAYKDGVSLGSLGTPATAVGNFIIGNRDSGDRTLAGTIYSLAIYNITLSSTQVGLIAAAMAAL